MIQLETPSMARSSERATALCFSAVVLFFCCGSAASQSESNELAKLAIKDGQHWSFLNGPWSDGPQAELIPPDGGGKEYVALVKQREYSDFKARFRFKFRQPHGGIRFLFRFQDSAHYYALDVPWCGQQNRNRHFWAGIVRNDGGPLQHYLHLGLVLGVVPEHERWYQAEVECAGPRIRAWIEGRLVADLKDDRYKKGRVGMMSLITAGNKSPRFANLELEGRSATASTSVRLALLPQHWITPNPQVDPNTFQSYPSQLVKGKSGSVALAIPYGNPNVGEVRRTVWVRSRDGGRTWSSPEPANLPQENLGAVFVKQDGTWVSLYIKPAGPPQQGIFAFESKDEGRTWSGPKTAQIVGEFPKEFSLPAYNYDRPLRLRDGSILFAVSCLTKDPPDFQTVSTVFVFRSTDEGETWAGPVRTDRNNRLPEDKEDRWFCPANFTEIGLAEARPNVVLGFGRPRPWPYMWQVTSNDGGRSWEPAAFGPFPGYCITLTSTQAGALVAVKRFPYLSANVSYDGGVTWDTGTIVDYPLWANHHAIEVEPNVVLVAYMGHIVEHGQADARIVRLKVTDRGLVLDH